MMIKNQESSQKEEYLTDKATIKEENRRFLLIKTELHSKYGMEELYEDASTFNYLLRLDPQRTLIKTLLKLTFNQHDLENLIANLSSNNIFSIYEALIGIRQIYERKTIENFISRMLAIGIVPLCSNIFNKSEYPYLQYLAMNLLYRWMTRVAENRRNIYFNRQTLNIQNFKVMLQSKYIKIVQVAQKYLILFIVNCWYQFDPVNQNASILNAFQDYMAIECCDSDLRAEVIAKIVRSFKVYFGENSTEFNEALFALLIDIVKKAKSEPVLQDLLRWVDKNYSTERIVEAIEQRRIHNADSQLRKFIEMIFHCNLTMNFRLLDITNWRNFVIPFIHLRGGGLDLVANINILPALEYEFVSNDSAVATEIYFQLVNYASMRQHQSLPQILSSKLLFQAYRQKCENSYTQFKQIFKWLIYLLLAIHPKSNSAQILCKPQFLQWYILQSSKEKLSTMMQQMEKLYKALLNLKQKSEFWSYHKIIAEVVKDSNFNLIKDILKSPQQNHCNKLFLKFNKLKSEHLTEIQKLEELAYDLKKKKSTAVLNKIKK